MTVRVFDEDYGDDGDDQIGMCEIELLKSERVDDLDWEKHHWCAAAATVTMPLSLLRALEPWHWF